MSTGLGPPRLWQKTTSVVLDAFEAAVETQRGGAGALLREGLAEARRALVSYCETLIERQMPDATLLAMAFEGNQVHVLSVGPGRIYRHRRGQPERLTSRDTGTDGVLRGRSHAAVHSVDPKDLVIAGSASAFSTRSVGRVAAALESNPETKPAVLVSLLIEPPRRAGLGASALALRLR